MGKKYSEKFKMSAVKSLLMPGSIGLNATAKKFNIPSSTLYTWKQKCAKDSSMNKKKNWSPEDKLNAVIETASMTEQELGEYLRSNGLHSDDLKLMRQECLPRTIKKGRPMLDPEVSKLRKENKQLNRDLKRKDAALSEYAARVILLKKSHEIWGEKEDES